MDSAEIKAPQNIEKMGGTHVANIDVQIGTTFLDHFSEQLYSSPQKAFEELISNGWDAGAKYVDVRIPDNLESSNATLSVLDNGASMDIDGLKQLWQIATSSKAGVPQQWGREMVGKFGIGKLATYILANKFTYICKAEDGLIRRVTMDYADLSDDNVDGKPKLISDIPLEVFEVDEENFLEFLKTTPDGEHLTRIISKGIESPEIEPWDDEFLAAPSAFKPPPSGTWTLVLLTELKPAGKNLKAGILKRMLRSALPFGSEMAICLNDEQLTSSKTANPVDQDWVIGPALKIDKIRVKKIDLGVSSVPATPRHTDENQNDSGSQDDQEEYEEIAVSSGDTPVPHIKIDGIDGIITGRIRLFRDEISSGKSEERSASNGFHINVRGRTVNQDDPYFGETNMSHSVWARFRMTVRADGLNEFLIINREQFHKRAELAIFRAFLRQSFNKVRSSYNSDAASSLTDTSDLLVKSLGVVSLNPLRSFVSKSLEGRAQLPSMIDDSGVNDKSAKLDSWKNETSQNIRNALSEVKFEDSSATEFVQYRISDNALIINKDHPFALEYAKTRREKKIVEAFSSVTFLSDVYALDIGIEPNALKEVMQYRDKLMRARALQTRQSGIHIAHILSKVQHDSNFRMLEAALSSALSYLGFEVEDMAKSGEPEGLARAYPLPAGRPTATDPATPLYTVSFDAKSTTHEKAKTSNIGLDGVHDHKTSLEADYALVVAPNFQEGALPRRAEQQEVTPMRARDLGRLVEITAEFGAIPLIKLEEIFSLHDPDEIQSWVDNVVDWIKSVRVLTLDLLLQALEFLKGKIPDSLPASTVALVCREQLGATQVTNEHVIAVAQGLNILVPDLVGLDGDKIVINASSERVAAAVQAQLDRLHDKYEDHDDPVIE
tara:strand:+ start:938 stop:3613 length:2676 start_codon:yes stop_codon:yes gene_type:complete